MRLHDYWRSSAAYRVRIALDFKDLAYEQIAVDLRNGAQRAPEFLALNPQGLVPVLEDEGAVLTQSLPILNYLEERYPEPALLPQDPHGRAASRAIAVAIAARSIRSTTSACSSTSSASSASTSPGASPLVSAWIAQGLGPLEAMLRRVLRRRRAEPGRRLPGAAGLQRTPLRFRPPRRIRRSAGSTSAAASSTRSPARRPSASPMP